MPGVIVTTNVRSGPSAVTQPASGQFFVVGQFERGNVLKPTTITSSSEVYQYFGSRTTYSDAYDQLLTYFAEGGQQAVVARVVGASATAGTLQLSDRASTPVPTLSITASNPGAWSSFLTVEVVDGPTADTFRMVIRISGATVEDYGNLTSPADAVAKFKNSKYVTVTSLGSASVVPTNNPVAIVPTPLTAGNDQRGTITSTTYLTALTQFAPEFGDGAVAIPGQTGAVVWAGINDHCKDNNRIGILAATKGETITNLQNLAAAMNTEYCGLFHPWVEVPTSAGGVKVISPEGFVAGVRSRAHTSVGPWRAPAGALGKSSYLTNTDQTYTSQQGDQLDNAKVNIIRKQSGTPLLYGWRSLSNDSSNWLYLKDRDLLNRISVEATKRLEQFVFEPIDNKGQLLARVVSELVAMVDPIARANGSRLHCYRYHRSRYYN
jgi:hypothetical protein